MFRKLKRRTEKRTNYRSRLASLKSGSARAVVKRNLRNIVVQFIGYKKEGDVVLSQSMSKYLKKYGWNYHGGNIPSAYLTGFLAGLKAKKSNVTSANLDIGLQASIKGNGLYAAALGIKDSGIDLGFGEAAPPAERVSGRHIADYAKKLKAENKQKYQKIFSSYLKESADPEKMPEQFEDVRKKIAEEFDAKAPALKAKEEE